MKVGFFLVVNQSGSIKTYKSRPNLSWDEIAVYQTITLPDALFKKPQIEASIVIPDAAAQPQEITAEVAMNAKEAIEQATGMEVRLIIESPESE